MTLLVDARWDGAHGIGRYGRELVSRLEPDALLARGPRPSSPVDPAYLAGVLHHRRPTTYLSPGFNAPAAAPRTSRVVITVHDLVHRSLPGFGGRVRRIYLERFVRKAALDRRVEILTVSQCSREAIVEWLGTSAIPVTVVGDGISTGFAPPPDDGARVPGRVLAGANDRPHKRLLDVVGAAEQLAAGGRRVALALFGAASPALVAELASRSVRVELLGVLSDAQLQREQRAASVFVAASAHEGFDLPFVEALASATPAVASDIAIHREVAHGAPVTWFGPTTQLAGAIAEALDAPAGLEPRLAAAAVVRRAHSWDEVADRVQAVLAR
jgi:glycosyltransferase involved in cell wall biosynthesis